MEGCVTVVLFYLHFGCSESSAVDDSVIGSFISYLLLVAQFHVSRLLSVLLLVDTPSKNDEKRTLLLHIPSGYVVA